ncbi:MAG: DUF1622 domain-containing protein [Pseudomonadota bacterium]|nr:DUF1622 domain-containing protein [Pseudomonadota bacterium]
MLEQLSQSLVPPVVIAIELIGVTIIAAGALVTLGLLAFNLVRRERIEKAVGDFRTALGRVILVGLEFLVAADIINTVVVELTLENVASLAIIVLIRTLLSFSLEAEIEGRWPWQRGGDQERHE